MRGYYWFVRWSARWNKSKCVSVLLTSLISPVCYYVCQILARLTFTGPQMKESGRLAHSICVLLSTIPFAYPEPSFTNSFHRFAHPRISNNIPRIWVWMGALPRPPTSSFILAPAFGFPCWDGDFSPRGDCLRPESRRSLLGLDGVGEEGVADPWRFCLDLFDVLGVLRGGKEGCGGDAMG